MKSEGMSDLLLTLLCLAMFAVGFTFGFSEIGKWTGMVSLGISGSLSLGIRLMLFRSGLLFPVGDNGYGPGYIRLGDDHNTWGTGIGLLNIRLIDEGAKPSSFPQTG